MDGWSPSIPQGEAFELGTPEFETTEELGITQIGNVGFVLVAGGLGERLGYNGTKVSRYVKLFLILPLSYIQPSLFLDNSRLDCQ